MVVSEALFAGLIDDASMFPPGNAAATDAVSAHTDYRRAWFAPLIGPLVVRDTDLAVIARSYRELHRGAADLAVSMIDTAGGLRTSADVRGVRVVAVESALRDLDNLAGNATRVASAAADLGDQFGRQVGVFVEFPFAPGWEKAVEAVAMAGLFGKIRTGGPYDADTPPSAQLARQLHVLIDADLPFKATAGLHHACATAGVHEGRPGQHGFLNVLLAVAALLDGASEGDVAELLSSADPPLEQLRGWDESEVALVRRRLLSFGCCGVLDPVGDLVALGLVREIR